MISILQKAAAPAGTLPVMHVIFGSHLYGTATAESDLDIRSVYMADARSILLGRGLNSAMSIQEGLDVAGHSLPRFLHLIGSLEMGAVEMLFAADRPGLSRIHHPAMRQVIENRERLLAGTSRSIIGHARNQLGRIAPDRARRLKSYEDAVSILRSCREASPRDCLETLTRIDGLEEGAVFLREHRKSDLPFSEMSDEEKANIGDRKGAICIRVRSRMVPAATKIRDAIRIFEKPIKKAGERSRKAAEDSIDWKGVQHGVRLLSQGIELFETRSLTFPRPEAPMLRRIRAGEIPIDTVSELIEEQIARLHDLERDFPFPEAPDGDLAEEVIMDAHLSVLRNAGLAYVRGESGAPAQP